MDKTLPAYEAQHDELWALSVMARTMDGVRFRTWGVQPDTQRERPSGFNRSMIDAVAALRQGEQALNAAIKDALANDNPSLKTTFNQQKRPFVQSVAHELGEFLIARKENIEILGGLTAQQWQRTINDPERGEVTLAQLAVERANSDQEYLTELARLRDVVVRNEALQVR